MHVEATSIQDYSRSSYCNTDLFAEQRRSSGSPLLNTMNSHSCGPAVINASSVCMGQMVLMQAVPNRGYQVKCQACGKKQNKWTACFGVVFAKPTPTLAKRTLAQQIFCSPHCYKGWCNSADAQLYQPLPLPTACDADRVILASNMGTEPDPGLGVVAGDNSTTDMCLVLPCQQQRETNCAAVQQASQQFLATLSDWSREYDAVHVYLPACVHKWAEYLMCAG